MSIKSLYSTDETILRGIRASNDDALNHLYKTCYPIIRNMILKNNGSEQDIDDVFQEGIIVFYEKVRTDDFKLTCSINTFIYSVCRNHWLKHLKRKSLTIEFQETYQPFDLTKSDIEDENILNERQKILIEVLNNFGEPCKSILQYFYYEQISMDKIAEKLGYTNAANAKNQKCKCLNRLRAIMLQRMKGVERND
jgi:RNA polymerase sigma factor (sigma-70 family)